MQMTPPPSRHAPTPVSAPCGVQSQISRDTPPRLDLSNQPKLGRRRAWSFQQHQTIGSSANREEVNGSDGVAFEPHINRQVGRRWIRGAGGTHTPFAKRGAVSCRASDDCRTELWAFRPHILPAQENPDINRTREDVDTDYLPVVPVARPRLRSRQERPFVHANIKIHFPSREIQWFTTIVATGENQP